MIVLLVSYAASPRRGSIDRTVVRLRRPAAGESSQAIAKPENSEDRPGLDILICALLLCSVGDRLITLAHSLIHNFTMGKGRGPDCCGACSCGICCPVFILLAGVVTWACVWGIEYNPNVNVKTLDVDLREIRVNIYNRNLYATDCVEIKILPRIRAESSRHHPRHRRDACSIV